MKRKWIPRYKWRKLTTISLDGLGDRDQIKAIAEAISAGYKYDKGFVAVAHRHGYNGDDFMRNAYSIVFYLIRVPRFDQKVKRKQPCA